MKEIKVCTFFLFEKLGFLLNLEAFYKIIKKFIKMENCILSAL